MIYVTGDTHGEVSRFEELKRKYFLSRQDTLIVAGDFGCIFGMGRRDEAKLDVLAALSAYLEMERDQAHITVTRERGGSGAVLTFTVPVRAVKRRR